MPSIQDYAPVSQTRVGHALYAFFIKLLFGKVKSRIASDIVKTNPKHIVDIGCGPGFLLKKIHELDQDITSVGIDPDPEMVRRARGVTARSHSKIIEANAVDLPLDDSSTDTIVSSLAFHHLTTHQKEIAVREIGRILEKNGDFWLFDFVPATNMLGKIINTLSPERRMIEDNVSGKVQEILEQSGFTYEKTYWTIYGCIALQRYIKQ